MKAAVDMFEQRQAMRGVEVRSDVTGAKSKVKTEQSVSTNANTAVPTEDQCFNCSRIGHRKPLCPYEERPKDFCYKSFFIIN